MSLQFFITKVLPSGTTLESLYQINDQSIWFLIWILKKVRFWPDLTKEVLEEPFTVKRYYWTNAQIYKFFTTKNNKIHGIYRSWNSIGEVMEYSYWKDGKQDGISRIWKSRILNSLGRLVLEEQWEDGTPISWKN